jgi:hypothetical protein
MIMNSLVRWGPYCLAAVLGATFGILAYRRQVSNKVTAAAFEEAALDRELLASLPGKNSILVASSYERGWLLGNSPGNDLRARWFVASDVGYKGFKTALTRAWKDKSSPEGFSVSNFPHAPVQLRGFRRQVNIYEIEMFTVGTPYWKLFP